MTRFLITAFLIFNFITCNQKETIKSDVKSMTVKDPHTYSKPEEATISHLKWDVKVDFEQRVIYGVAKWDIVNTQQVNTIIFDSKGLKIEKVTLDQDEKETDFSLGNNDEILGAALKIQITPETKAVNIYYHTGNEAEALQWLDPVQTADGNHPFLFTQSQAILARSWIPIQDSPGIRFTYAATVRVVPGLMALMSAENPQEKNPEGIYTFKMDQPIPAYLMALAVGDITFKSISDRTGVYAEPSIIDASVNEFVELESMVAAAEKLYGPYRWDRYDLIVLPPSFPFGGMENPRLTFATPTILAGDRSLTSLVAHELAHSWSGNLVTNATWNDFWLNEGFTVYFEYRIMEALKGREYSEMLATLSLQDLQREIENLVKDGKEDDTKLKLNLAGKNPDDGFTSIAYDKGYFFLRFLEEASGREKFDDFLKEYFSANAFKSITTEAFLEYLHKNLIEEHKLDLEKSDLDSWIYQTGLPSSVSQPVSEKFNLVNKVLDQWKNEKPITELISREDLISKEWSTHQWLHFIRHLPENMTAAQMNDLDNYLQFTYSRNTEILTAWFVHVIRNQYTAGYENLENFLISVGRRKFLVPLYGEMIKTEEGKEMARKIYAKARQNYHFVSTNTLDDMIGWEEPVL